MDARLTVRRGLPFLFSHAVAAFPTKHAAKEAIKAVATSAEDGIYRFGSSNRPHEVVHTLEDIRSALREKGVEFLDPLPEEIYGKFGLPRYKGGPYEIVMPESLRSK
jgi:hypothetical protein